MIELIGVGFKDSLGSEEGIFPTVSTECSAGDAESEINLELLGLNSLLSLTGETKIASGLGRSYG